MAMRRDHHSRDWFMVVLVLIVVICQWTSCVEGAVTVPRTGLIRHFYKINNTCPDIEAYIKHQVKIFFDHDKTITPKLLRLLYSDCFVTGCDASILLDGPQSEKKARQNVGLGGFEFINLLKRVVEKMCPGVVSCADILNLATRDAVHLAGAPSYPVLLGRRDGFGSNIASVDLPSPSISWESALSYFESKGLDVLDMTTLLGAHTMGSTHCSHILDRLYNFKGSKKPDPHMDPSLLSEMRKMCPPKTRKGQRDPTVFLNPDNGKKFRFNNTYYSRLLKQQGVLGIDQELLYGEDTKAISEEFGIPTGFEDFRRSWALSMARMGSIGVLTGTNKGEIRRDCRYPNKRSN